MTRRLSPIAIVSLAVVLFVATGVAVAAANPSDAGADAAPAVTPSENAETEPTGDAFGTNVSVHSEGFDEAERDFYASRDAVENRSDSLVEIAETIQTANAYTEADHERSNENLWEMEDELQAFDDAEADARDELMDADLRSTERFLVLESIEEERNTTSATVDSALGQYETAVRTQRTDVRSTVSAYFGGALLAGLLAGALLGAVVPLLEAKKTGDKMKLSRNVSYKKRAGLIPVVLGLVIIIGAVGLLGYVGAIDLIQVIV